MLFILVYTNSSTSTVFQLYHFCMLLEICSHPFVLMMTHRRCRLQRCWPQAPTVTPSQCLTAFLSHSHMHPPYSQPNIPPQCSTQPAVILPPPQGSTLFPCLAPQRRVSEISFLPVRGSENGDARVVMEPE